MRTLLGEFLSVEIEASPHRRSCEPRLHRAGERRLPGERCRRNRGKLVSHFLEETMATKLKLYELPGSPNNVKARLALGYKKLAYDSEPLKLDGYPGDRSKIVAVSGQPLTPVLVHGDTVVFDSAAIIRYLDANFRQTPPLFSSDHQEMAVIEDWELYTKTKLSEPVGMSFGQVIAAKPDRAACDRACTPMPQAT